MPIDFSAQLSCSRRSRASATRCAAFLVAALLLAPAALAAGGEGAAPACSRIELFHREGCPHCARARSFLVALAREIPTLLVVERDVLSDPAAARGFRARMDRLPGVRPGVPLLDVCGTLLVGFDRAGTTGALLRNLVIEGPSADGPDATGVALPLIGRVDAGELGLPLFTVAVGLVDGFNPCAMWVLLFLLSILVHLRSRWRILAVAGTFVLVSGLVYFAFMAAWLELFLVVGFSRPLQLALGAVALLVAAVHVKDFATPGSGPSLSIPGRAKPGIHSRVRAVVQAQHLTGAVAAVAVLAVLVNLLELLCTAGLPALYTQVLSRQGLGTAGHYAYLALYNAAYVLDDALLVAGVTWTLRRAKLQERAGRGLKLLSGTALGALGLLLILRPQWLF